MGGHCLQHAGFCARAKNRLRKVFTLGMVKAIVSLPD